MKLGLDHHTVPSAGHRATAFELLDLAHRLGLDGVLFSTPASFETHDAQYLAHVRRRADERGLSIEWKPSSSIWRLSGRPRSAGPRTPQDRAGQAIRSARSDCSLRVFAARTLDSQRR